MDKVIFSTTLLATALVLFCAPPLVRGQSHGGTPGVPHPDHEEGICYNGPAAMCPVPVTEPGDDDECCDFCQFNCTDCVVSSWHTDTEECSTFSDETDRFDGNCISFDLRTLPSPQGEESVTQYITK